MAEPSQAPLQPLAAPAVIGPFRIARVLGQGGLGVVYLGERTEPFTQRVAIKVLHPEISLVLGDDLLRQEEHILTSLDHPGIVRLLDRGEASTGAHFIVMEYIEGLPLLDYCRERNASETERIGILLQISQAVDYAHRRLSVHGDLKPQNILVTQAGQPKLLDFGVAAQMRLRNVAVAPTYTPDFASPEQLAGARLTPASDVYSLGLVAAALLPPPPLGSDVGIILQKASRLDPEDRYATARDFANDLQAILDHRPISARPQSQTYLLHRWIRRHRTAAAMAAVVLAALLGSAMGVTVQSARAIRERRIAENRLRDLVRLTGTLEGELYSSATPLAHAEQARATLLQGTTGTLDRLGATAQQDPQLALEMARQYETLGRLELAESSIAPQHAFSAQHDLERARMLLDGPARHVPAANAELQKTTVLSQKLSPR